MEVEWVRPRIISSLRNVVSRHMIDIMWQDVFKVAGAVFQSDCVAVKLWMFHSLKKKPKERADLKYLMVSCCNDLLCLMSSLSRNKWYYVRVVVVRSVFQAFRYYLVAVFSGYHTAVFISARISRSSVDISPRRSRELIDVPMWKQPCDDLYHRIENV